MIYDLSSKREEYGKSSIDYSSLPNKPFPVFESWYKEAEESKTIQEENACTLTTVNNNLQPKARVVLMKEFSENGIVIYTNYHSEKGQAIEQNPNVCISFFWYELEQQIIILGKAEKVSAEKSDDYFNQRPRRSRLGAILSDQSKALDLDFNMENAIKNLEKEHENKTITRPNHWGGYLIRPISFEFWQGKASRLHDRFRYTKNHSNWKLERLWP